MSLILAIESAIGGGSLCIRDGDQVLAEIAGTGGVSRAEELLISIDSTLSEAGVSLASLDTIAVSTGPGSYTGIRIGIATALGLRRAVSARCLGVSLFEALAASVPKGGKLVAALEIRNNEAAWQGFRSEQGGLTAVTSPAGGSYDEFAAFMNGLPDFQLVADPTFAGMIANIHTSGLKDRIQFFDSSFANLIAAAVLYGIGSEPEPLYLRATGGRF